ncbi:alpha/beta hydrolase [Thermomonas sp.]|uniref:alpha/beta hydrolase n=1 Tax=Thermomonas sp. TaxID=1971895 RepID=UPI0035B20D8C
MPVCRHLVALLLLSCLPAARAAQPAPEAPPAHQSITLDSAVMHERRRINLYLPPERAADRRYPVIYMPDGGLAEDFPHVADTIDLAIREGRMAPVILVGIENTQRRRDMTGPTTVKSDRKIAPVVGGSAAFRSFIASELVPWVEANLPASDRRGIIGESAAGLFIVETFFAMPGLFETSIALDPSLWWNAGKLAKDAAPWLAAHPALRGRLYVAWAEPETIGPNVRVLEDALTKAAPVGLQWQVVARPDLDHGSIYRAVAPVVLPAMFPPE